MSALPLKADMLSVSIDVRFVPLTDIPARSFPSLIGWRSQVMP